MSIQRGKGAFLDHVFFCLSMVSTRIFHQLVGLGQYSTSGVAPLCPVNRHESDPFVESAFSSQALHPTYQRHSWPLQALSRRLRSSQQRPPSPIPFFVEHPSTGYDLDKIVNSWTSIQNIIVQGAIETWQPKIEATRNDLCSQTQYFATTLWGILLCVVGSIESLMTSEVEILVRRVCQSELQNPNRNPLISYPAVWKGCLFFCSKRKPGRGILYQNPKRGRSLLVCHGPGKHCIRHASK